MNLTRDQGMPKQSSRLQIWKLVLQRIFIEGTQVISTNKNKRRMNTCMRAYATSPMIYKNNTVITTIHHCLRKE
jgi:hypothetical protein